MALRGKRGGNGRSGALALRGKRGRHGGHAADKDRLTLRHFTEQDMAALHLLLQDEAVNTFLPWFPMKT